MAMFVDGFYDAKTARDIAIGGTSRSTAVLNEIHTIQDAIMAAANASHLEIETQTLTGPVPGIVTPYTQNLVNFNAWNDPSTYQDDASRVARAQMNEIIGYFTRLGYAIGRTRDGINQAFRWTCKW